MKLKSISLLVLPLVAMVSCDKPAEHMIVSGGSNSATGGSAAVPTMVAPAPVSAPVVAAAPKAPEPVKPAPAAPAASTPAPAPAAVAAAPTGPLKKYKPEFPSPEFAGTPLPADNTIPNLDKSGKPITEIDIPEGVDVISKKAKVTSSDPNPFTGSLDLVTDGEKNGADGYYVELTGGPQWVQIDLGGEKEVHGVWVWHSHKQAVVYKGVVVGVSNDPEFKNPTFIFNNDYDNSVSFGNGPDLSYTETNHGRWMAAKSGPVKGQFVRLYSCGRYIDDMNHYVEVEVFGK
jgi:hypothetical protein